MNNKTTARRINSRAKGQRGEREVIKLLQPVVDRVYAAAGLVAPVLQRNTLQSDRGGYDIVGLEWLALEVKRVEKPFQAAWWRQTIKQARKDQVPVVFYRRNGETWDVRWAMTTQGTPLWTTAADYLTVFECLLYGHIMPCEAVQSPLSDLTDEVGC